MKLESRQFLQQRQELQLSLFQKQALQILQMPTTDLVQYIKQEAESNPYIELQFKDINNEEEINPSTDFDETSPNSIETIGGNSISADYEDTDMQSGRIDNASEVPEDIGGDLETWDNDYRRTNDLANLSYNPDIQEWVESKFSNLKDRETLRSYLMKQLYTEFKDPKEIQIGESIIASINSRGHFVGNTEDIANEFNVTPEEVEKILSKIQGFDPPGIGAKNVRECLLIQIKQSYPNNILLRKLIEDYYDELIHRQITKIAKGLKIEPYEVEDLIKQLKSLNPFPGHLFPDEPEIIIPDVTVRLTEDDELTIELYDRYLPEIRIIKPVEEENIKQLPKEQREQIEKYKESAIRLEKCVDRRNSTLLKVSKEIVYFQENFMRKGEEYLKPMTYKTIADRLGIHESTISRCIAGKYISTPQGIFDFRYFFSGGMKKDEGENELSSRTVKTIIKRIIDEEDKTKPLSDQQIAELVQKQEGIKIARRTVSKYREELKIPNAFERKVYSK